MASISDPYIERGEVERLVANLEDAKYTLAVLSMCMTLA